MTLLRGSPIIPIGAARGAAWKFPDMGAVDSCGKAWGVLTVGPKPKTSELVASAIRSGRQ